MFQILFHLPFTAGFMPPDGVPVYGFGAMLFVCFVATAMIWGPIRAKVIGLPREAIEYFAMTMFLTGIAGARLVYMIQYRKQFEGKNLVAEFFKIWEGGIVFYGSVIGGVIGFYFFNRFYLRKFAVSIPKLMDVVAPLLALGLAIGRIGCYLNGCCWGQVAVPEVQPMPPLPISWSQFPLIPSHARDDLTIAPTDKDQKERPHVLPYRGVQTSVGFSTRTEKTGTLVVNVEPGSEAEKAGLKPGDRIVEVNGVENPRKVDELEVDTLTELLMKPQGRSRLDLKVQRGRETIDIGFVPRTMTFFATQLYEMISMVLLVLLLVAFQPFRRHDGQVMILMMCGYAVHRFFNEAIRIEPTYALGLTLSQWISVFILFAAAGLELWLRKTQKKLPKGPNPANA